MARVPLFADLPPAALETLAGHMQRRRLAGDAPIFYRGDPGGALYVIVSGRVKVHGSTAEGSEVIYDVLGPGNFFGDMSLLDGKPRSADVSTLEPTELLLLEGEALRETIEAQPSVAWTLLRILSQRLREQNDQVEMLMTRDVAGRVAALLLRLGRMQGTPLPPDGRRIRLDVQLSQGDIAAFVGATRERVSRILSNFRARGVLDWDKPNRCWIILDPDALAKRAQL